MPNPHGRSHFRTQVIRFPQARSRVNVRVEELEPRQLLSAVDLTNPHFSPYSFGVRSLARLTALPPRMTVRTGLDARIVALTRPSQPLRALGSPPPEGFGADPGRTPIVGPRPPRPFLPAGT